VGRRRVSLEVCVDEASSQGGWQRQYRAIEDNLSSDSLTMQVSTGNLQVYNMDEMFIHVPTRFEKNSIDDWVPSNGSPVKSLFDVLNKLDLDSVRKTSYYMFDYRMDYMVQSLIWSGQKFLSSCNAELKEKILEQAACYHEFEQMGPVYLCLVLDLMQLSMNAVLCTLTHALETIHLRMW